jgi:uncharacterized protein (TIGR01732 family)
MSWAGLIYLHRITASRFLEVLGMSNEVGGGTGYGNGFTLIVVLFILLIIVGAAFLGGEYC